MRGGLGWSGHRMPVSKATLKPDECYDSVEPAAQSEQYVPPVMLEYFPAEHFVHALAKLDPPTTCPY